MDTNTLKDILCCLEKENDISHPGRLLNICKELIVELEKEKTTTEVWQKKQKEKELAKEAWKYVEEQLKRNS